MKLIRLLVLSSVFAAVSYACPCSGKSDTVTGDKAPAPTTEQSKG